MTEFPTARDETAERDLKRRIDSFLAMRRLAPLHFISVEVTGQTILLQGVVDTFYARQLAQECVQRVAGVRKVINQVVVATVIDSEGECDPAADILVTLPVHREAA